MLCKVHIKNVSIKTNRGALPQLEGFSLVCTSLFTLFANWTLGFGLNYVLENHTHLMFLTSGFLI